MKYRSTRGGEIGLSFQDVLFAGYAKDGGLYMPEEIPKLSEDELDSWAGLTYRQLVYSVARKFIDVSEVPDDDLQAIINSAYNKFDPSRMEEIALVDINKTSQDIKTSSTNFECLPDSSKESSSFKGSSKEACTPLWVLELFHGPTLAFKDLGLSFVAGFLDYFLNKHNRHVTILVGTSGDTGGAAIASVGGRSNVDLVVLLPRGRCSQPQLLQMITSSHNNVVVYDVDGTPDDLDVPIKHCFADPSFVRRHNLMSINSINWGRILGQIPHYVWAYFRLCGGPATPRKRVEVVVPTGAAGNITSGCLARALGLPLTLVTAVNENDVMARLLRSGDFAPTVGIEPMRSFSCAMDIQVPYNVERLVYLFSCGDVVKVKHVMGELELGGRFTLPSDCLQRMREVITHSIVNGDDKVLKVMREVHDRHHYLLCPHTAVGVAHHYDCPPSEDVPRCYVATASPAKFPNAVLRAFTAVAPAKPPAEARKLVEEACAPLAHLSALPHHFLTMDGGQDWGAMLQGKVEELTLAWEERRGQTTQ